MSLHVSSDELRDILDRQKADKLAPVQKLPKSTVKTVVREPRSWHTYVLIGLVSVFAYLCLGLGWLIGAVGDAIYEVGKRAHEAKWNIH